LARERKKLDKKSSLTVKNSAWVNNKYSWFYLKEHLFFYYENMFNNGYSLTDGSIFLNLYILTKKKDRIILILQLPHYSNRIYCF